MKSVVSSVITPRDAVEGLRLAPRTLGSSSNEVIDTRDGLVRCLGFEGELRAGGDGRNGRGGCSSTGLLSDEDRKNVVSPLGGLVDLRNGEGSL